MRRSRRYRTGGPAVGLATGVLLLTAHLTTAPGEELGSGSRVAGEQAGGRPTIVVIMADDMAMTHLAHMPSTRRLIFARGARFTDHHVNIALCCPARVSMFAGRYSHNTGVSGNSYPDGFHGFRTGGERRTSYAIALRRRAGYRTALVGKYLNEYPLVDSRPRFAVPDTYVPPGWTDWVVPVRGDYYTGWRYTLNSNGRTSRREGPRDYLGDLLARRAVGLLRRHDGGGLLLVLSLLGPHNPEPASPIEKRNAELRERLAAVDHPRTPDFDERDVDDKPEYVRELPRLGPRAERRMDRRFRRQVLSSKSTDRYVRKVVDTLRRTGRLDNTYVVFTSDHGSHLGAHRLRHGKNTPYVTDTRVPFAIRGPGITPGTRVDALTGNIDLAATLADMAGVELHYRHDGESLLPLARGRNPAWRQHFLVRRGRPRAAAVPKPGDAPMFTGVVSRDWQYVRYVTGERELYDRVADPFQLENLMAAPEEEWTPEQRAALRSSQRALRGLVDCSGVVDCRR